VRIPLAAVAAVTACLATVAVCFAAAGLAASRAVAIDGAIALKPIAIKSCKSGTGRLEGERVTQIQCTSSGVLRGLPRLGGVSNGWLWTLRPAGRTDEIANLGVNFGNGVATLALTGSVKVIGASTATSGHAITTGIWKLKQGTGVYKGLRGRGTYSFDIKRTATRYISLTMTLHGVLR
jgi:hypothetical protein